MTDHQQELYDMLLNFPRTEAARRVQKRSPMEFVLQYGWWYEPCQVPEDIPGKGQHIDPWFAVHGGAEHSFRVVMINDDAEPAEGKLVLSLETQDHAAIASRQSQFRLAGLGREAYQLGLLIPKGPGKYLLKAVAYPQGTGHKSPTVSRRKLLVEPAQSVREPKQKTAER